MSDNLDSGQRRLMELVFRARSINIGSPPPETGRDIWFDEAHRALSDELVDFGIDDVIVNRYGIALESLIDRLSDMRIR